MRLLLWLAAGLFVLSHMHLNLLSLRGQPLIDFHVYHEALGRAAAGKPIYNLDDGMPFLYPPFFLMILRPLGGLSEPVATSIWLYLQNVLLLVSLIALLGVFPTVRAPLAPAALILFAGYSPVMLNNLYGQTNPLYLALLSLFVLGYTKSANGGRGTRAWEIAASLALATAIGIRILPLALIALAAIQRRYRIVAWTAGLVAVETLVAGLALGFDTERCYFTRIMPNLRGLENMREISLLAMLQRLLPSWAAVAVFATAVAAGVAVFFAFVYRHARNRTCPPALPLAFVITSTVLFAPLLEYHHYTVLLASYVLVLGSLLAGRRLSLQGALPLLFSWAMVSVANYCSFYSRGELGYFALAGAALIWGYSARLIVAVGTHPPDNPPGPAFVLNARPADR